MLDEGPIVNVPTVAVAFSFAPVVLPIVIPRIVLFCPRLTAFEATVVPAVVLMIVGFVPPVPGKALLSEGTVMPVMLPAPVNGEEAPCPISF